MATALQVRVTAHEAVIDLQRRMTAIRFHGPGILATQIRRHINTLGQVINAQEREQLVALCQRAEQEIEAYSNTLRQAVRAIAAPFAADEGGDQATHPKRP